MLILPIKKKWFDMILSGEKKEEYREVKPYWTERLKTVLNVSKGVLQDDFVNVCESINRYVLTVEFRNGYGKNAPWFHAKCKLHVGTGKEEWGAEKDKKYFVLTIDRILCS